MTRIVGTTEDQRIVLDTGTFADAVAVEMTQQDATWGDALERGLGWAEWMLILGEEYGEAVVDAMALHFTNPHHVDTLRNFRRELIQVAALCGQMVKLVDDKVAKLDAFHRALALGEMPEPPR